MLPKINRIKKKKDFEIIFKNSKSFKTNLFIFRIMKNNLGQSRFGFVVSQKVSKKAVIRNKVRRRLTEIIKSKIENIKTDINLVVIALPGIEKKEFSDLKEAMNDALIKTKLVTKEYTPRGTNKNV
jgi:ribonuclease P protein component